MVNFTRSLDARSVVLALACVTLGACSTLMQGTGQQVALTTPGANGASCHLTGGDGVNVTVITPGSVRLPKSKKDINIACETAGQQTASGVLKSTYSDWSIVQPPVGYVVDGISGAMWVYPQTFAVPSDNGGQELPAATPSAAVAHTNS